MTEHASRSYTPTGWTDGRTPVVPASRLDVHVEVLGDEAVVYDGRAANTYHLNPPALSVWRQCDGKTSTQAMALHLVTVFDVDSETALDHVEQLVAMFADAGLLESEVIL